MAACGRQSIVFSSGLVFASVLATQQRQRGSGFGPLVVVAVATSTESVNPPSPLIAPELDDTTRHGDGRKQERDVAAGKRTKTVIKNQRLVDVPLAHVRHAGLHANLRSCSGGFVGMSCS